MKHCRRHLVFLWEVFTRLKLKDRENGSHLLVFEHTRKAILNSKNILENFLWRKSVFLLLYNSLMWQEICKLTAPYYEWCFLQSFHVYKCPVIVAFPRAYFIQCNNVNFSWQIVHNDTNEKVHVLKEIEPTCKSQ